MRKLLLICLMAIGFCGTSFAQLSLTPDQELTILTEGDIVAIWQKTSNKFLYGSGAQNLGFGYAEDVFKESNGGWLWLVEEGEGHFLFHLQKPGGGDYEPWGGAQGYLNSQPVDGGWCSFILGLNDQWGQDVENGALWDIEEVEGGFLLRNVATGLYLSDAGPANKSEENAAVWTFCTLADNSPLKSDKTLATNLLTNGDVDQSDNLDEFPLLHHGNTPEDDGGANERPEVVDGGVTGKCLKIVSDELEEVYNDEGNPAWTDWSTQFFVFFNKPLQAGDKYQFTFWAKADRDATIGMSAQAHPRNWTGGFGSDFDVTDEWQEFSFEGTVSEGMASKDEGFQSVAFALNHGDTGFMSNTYYFDNFNFSLMAPANDVQHNSEAIRVLFTDYTNIPALIQAAGKSRLMYPTDCVTVTVDGEAAPVQSVEADKKGEFMIFLDEDYVLENELTENNKVVVKFTNPADEAFRVTFLDDDKTAVADFEQESEFDEDLDIVSNMWANPELVSSEPETGSFNLPVTTNVFKLVFDKKVRGGEIVAKLDGKEALTVSPKDAEGNVEITLTRTGSGDLAEGDHTITVTKVYTWTPYAIPEGTEDAPVTLTFSVGAPAMSADLLTAIEEARTQLDNATVESERYLGTTYTALSDAIAKYEVEGVNYTAPSVLRAAIKDLSDKTKALENHMTLCDTYDNDLNTALDIVSKYAGTPFESHELYQALAAVTTQYEGKVLTEDNELTAAVDALDANVTAAQRMFSEGESRHGDTGIKVLVERIRLGKEALLALGVDENDEIIQLANNAMSDDDVLADRIKDHLKMKIYENLKDGVDLFDLIDMTDDGPVYGEVDMSVFIKNPNIYCAGGDHLGITDENVPGWVIPTTQRPGIDADTSWGNNRHDDEGVPEDACFNNWCSTTRMENTVTDLPAGLYVADLYANDWLGTLCGDAFAFATTYEGSDAALEPEEGEDPDRDLNYSKTMDLTAQANSRGQSHRLEPVEVVNGTLTIGVQFGRGTGTTQFMFDKARLYLVGAKEGHDYAADYNEIITGVVAAKTAKALAVEVYDLNGRRIMKTQKGLNIIKRQMSDGSVQTSKVVK